MSYSLCSVQLHSERGIKYAKYFTFIYIPFPVPHPEGKWLWIDAWTMNVAFEGLRASLRSISCEVQCSAEPILKVATLFELIERSSHVD